MSNIKQTIKWLFRKQPLLMYMIVFAIVLYIFAMIFGPHPQDSYYVAESWTSTTEVQNSDVIEEKIETVKIKNTSILIPGISAVDVYGNLKDIGFVCDWPTSYGGEVFWVCEDNTTEYSYIVEIVGETPSKITSIQATVLNYSSKSTKIIAKDFLWYVASVKYDGSNQVWAKNWVIANTLNKINKVFGTVRYTIAWNDRSRMLTIAHENSNLD